MTRLVDRDWGRELDEALSADATDLRIICPFIKVSVVKRLLAAKPGRLRVITRFNLNDFARGVSDIDALSLLLGAGASVRGVRDLHAKAYVFGSSRAMVTSANLTHAALHTNHEFGLVSGDAAVLVACQSYFDVMWLSAGADLDTASLTDWSLEVTARRVLAKPELPPLADHGAELGLGSAAPQHPTPFSDARQAFVKFLGRSRDRVLTTEDTASLIDSAGCNRALTYPTSKRPRAVEEGAQMFISRLTRDPNDIVVFGRAVGMAHVVGRDEATPAEIVARPWKADWDKYIRVRDAEFVAGPLANGVSLNTMMDALGAEAFLATQQNQLLGRGNINPRKAYMQQPAVQLSNEAMAWLSARFEAALARHGKVPADTLDRIG